MSQYLRDSRHAANLFGFTGTRLNTGTPRLKFQFFVNIRFSAFARGHVRRFLGSNARDTVNALCKTVTMPNISVSTEILNQYNRHRIVSKRVEPQTVSLTFHDTVDGLSLRLWEMYYQYYFRDGDNPGERSEFDTVSARFTDRFGYNLPQVRNNRQLIDSIEIFQIHGGRFSRVSAVAPTLTAFTHDTHDYAAAGETMQFQLDFQPEFVVYRNRNSQLSNSALERFDRGDFWEMFDFLNTANPVGEVNTDAVEQQSIEIAQATAGTTPTAFSTGNVFDANSALNLSRVQGGFDPVPGALTNFVAPTSTSVLAGKIATDSVVDRTLIGSVISPHTVQQRAPATVSVSDRQLLTGVSVSRDTR